MPKIGQQDLCRGGPRLSEANPYWKRGLTNKDKDEGEGTTLAGVLSIKKAPVCGRFWFVWV